MQHLRAQGAGQGHVAVNQAQQQRRRGRGPRLVPTPRPPRPPRGGVEAGGELGERVAVVGALRVCERGM